MFLIKLQCLICCKLSVFILFDCIIQISEHHRNLHIIMKLHTNVTSKMVVIFINFKLQMYWDWTSPGNKPGALESERTISCIWCYPTIYMMSVFELVWPSHNKQFYNIFFCFDQCCQCDPIFYNQNASFFHNIHLSTLLV